MKKIPEVTLLQKNTMAKFLALVGKKTISEYGEILGIERTRFFRLIHGAEMKMTEFEKFQVYLDQYKEGSVNWENEIKKTHQAQALGTGAGVDLNIQWQRNISLRELVKRADQIKEESFQISA